MPAISTLVNLLYLTIVDLGLLYKLYHSFDVHGRVDKKARRDVTYWAHDMTFLSTSMRQIYWKSGRV